VRAVLVGNFPIEYVEALDLLQLDGLLAAIEDVEADRRKSYVVDTSYGAQGDDKAVRKHFKALDRGTGAPGAEANPDDYLS
jgi:hypothetical protein